MDNYITLLVYGDEIVPEFREICFAEGSTLMNDGQIKVKEDYVKEYYECHDYNYTGDNGSLKTYDEFIKNYCCVDICGDTKAENNIVQWLINNKKEFYIDLEIIDGVPNWNEWHLNTR